MLPKSIQNLIDQFSKLPGVGPKTAARLAFYLLMKPEEDIEALGKSVLELQKGLKICQNCFNFSENDVCSVCSNEKRNKRVVAVVEEALDVVALEKSSGYEGVYHVLGGAISPINGIGPEELRISQLLMKIKDGGIEEIILSTNPNLEGEATAAYLKNKILEIDPLIKITRIARGLPMGGDLEYADEITLRRSLEGRRDY